MYLDYRWSLLLVVAIELFAQNFRVYSNPDWLVMN